MTTNVLKGELLRILRENRSKHQEAFEKAVKGYREEAIKELEENLENARNGKEFNVNSSLITPVNQIKDYNRAIQMTEWTEDNTIQLDEKQFENFVMDKWHWSKTFSISNKSYVIGDEIASTYYNQLENM